MIERDPCAFEHATLDNGGLAYWQHTPGASSVRLAVIVKTGSILDPPQQKGLAHLLEHMLFHGTDRYPTNMDLAIATESHGGSSNGCTTPDCCCYEISMPAYQMSLGWEILDQIIFHPRLDQSGLDKNRADVLTEIVSYEDSIPPKPATQLLQRRLFGRQFTRNIEVIGTETTVNQIELAAVQNFYRQYYQPGNMIFLAVGNLDQIGQPWPDFLNQSLAHYPATAIAGWVSTPSAPTSRPATISLPLNGITSPIVDINGRISVKNVTGRNGRPIKYDRVASLIQFILIDRQQSSVLYQELRERNHLIYSLDSGINGLTPLDWFWSLTTIVKNETVIDELLAIIRRVMTDPNTFTAISVAEAIQAKLGRMALEDLTPHDAFRWALMHLQQNFPIITRRQYGNEVASITPDNVLEVVESDFHPDRWVTMQYLPLGA